MLGGFACSRYLESYGGGDFNPYSAPFWKEGVSHAQGRARLNRSRDIGCQYGSPSRGNALGCRLVLDDWVSGLELVGEGDFNTARGHTYVSKQPDFFKRAVL